MVINQSIPPPDKLEHNGIHLWLTDFNQSSDHIQVLQSILSPAEQKRLNSFNLKRAHEFIIGRGVLRQILGHYLNVSPANLEFDYLKRGKPFLLNHNHLGLQFNLTHSHDKIIYAIARERAIGVDVEKVRVIPNINQLATRFFSETETEFLQSFPIHEQTIIFLIYWTCKEAFVKACGEGLAFPIRDVELTMDGGTVQFMKIRDKISTAQQWALRTLGCTSNWLTFLPSLQNKTNLSSLHFSHIGALVAEGQDYQLSQFSVADLFTKSYPPF